MKNLVRVLALVVVVSFALTALAASNKTDLKLSSGATLGTAKLAAGEYKVTWQGQGDAVTVSFLQDKKEVASAKAKLVEAKTAALHTAVLLKKNGSGQDTIAEIQVGGKKAILVFAE